MKQLRDTLFFFVASCILVFFMNAYSSYQYVSKVISTENGFDKTCVRLFLPIATSLHEKYDFPLCLPSVLPDSSSGDKWSVRADTGSNSFSLEFYLNESGEPLGKTMADYKFLLTGNSVFPSQIPFFESFKNTGISETEVKLSEDISAKKYTLPQDTLGNTAVTWEKNGWLFFVVASSSNDELGALNISSNILSEFHDFPGKYGVFIYGQTANEPYLFCFWEVNNSCFYEMNYFGSFYDAILLLESIIEIK